MRDSRHRIERNGQHDRDALRPLQCDRLRDQLAEHDGEVREDRERDRERDAGREGWLEEVGEQRLADGADEDGEHGDADLDEADEPDRLVHQAERRLRAAPAAGRLLLQAHSTRRDERVLGQHEERAPQHEEEHDHDVEKDSHAPSGAPVLGG